MKRVIKQMILFCQHLLATISFFAKLLVYRNFSNYLDRKYSGKVAVLANGPSLKGVLPMLTLDSFKDTDFVVLNFFAFDDTFFKIRPKHYCLADPMFFQKNHRIEDVRKLYKILNDKVDWNMNVYIPADMKKKFISFAGISNPCIKIIPINAKVDFHGFECLRNCAYEHNWTMPLIHTVALMAIYVAINSGYEEIDLYGVDHTYFGTLCVNEENQLCNVDTHFYDNGKPALKPIIRNDNDQIWKMSDYLTSLAGIFKGHDLLASYARYKGVRILNCTRGSMIDSYERLI